MVVVCSFNTADDDDDDNFDDVLLLNVHDWDCGSVVFLMDSLLLANDGQSNVSKLEFCLLICG